MGKVPCDARRACMRGSGCVSGRVGPITVGLWSAALCAEQGAVRAGRAAWRGSVSCGRAHQRVVLWVEVVLCDEPRMHIARVAFPALREEDAFDRIGHVVVPV